MPATPKQRPNGVTVPASRQRNRTDLASFSGNISLELKNGRTSKSERFAQDRSTQERPQTSTAKKSSSKRWSQRVTRESDALDLKRGVFKRRLQTDKREENRGVPQTIGRTKFTPQDRRLSLGAVDADLLHQPRRQNFAESTTHAIGAREGRTEASVSPRLTSSRRSRASAASLQRPKPREYLP